MELFGMFMIPVLFTVIGVVASAFMTPTIAALIILFGLSFSLFSLIMNDDGIGRDDWMMCTLLFVLPFIAGVAAHSFFVPWMQRLVYLLPYIHVYTS